jgi:glycosyltransferase involved in cell wall biosynthesis
MISNFLPAKYGTRAVQQDLRDKLGHLGYATIAVSPFRGGAARGMHMVSSVFLRRRDYDVAIVDVYSGRAFIWAEAVSLALAAVRKPFVMVLHGGNLPRLASRQPTRVARCLARASSVVAPSRYLREQMSPHCGDVALIPNGLDLERYHFRERRQVAPRLMWLRALHAIYNPEMAIHVLRNLLSDYPNAHLTMIGPDKLDGTAERVRALAGHLGVTSHVLMPGSIDKADVPGWLDRGDIFLNTTNADNTPVSVLEAMACGLPVVSTNVGGLPYLVNEGDDALLTPAGDHERMASAVRNVLGDPELAGRLSRNGRTTADRFDWQAIVPQWTALLDRISPARRG